jgi:oligoribonuclease (3'-5' exoribonuclease)
MADTQNVKAIDQWIGQIEAMQALKPEQVIPSHFAKQSLSPQSLDFVKNYLENYKKAVTENKTTGTIVEAMVKKYPDLPEKKNWKWE